MDGNFPKYLLRVGLNRRKLVVCMLTPAPILTLCKLSPTVNEALLSIPLTRTSANVNEAVNEEP